MSRVTRQRSPLFEASIVRPALVDAFRKLDPRRMLRNPVLFVVEVGALFTLLLFGHAVLTGQGDAPPGFILGVAFWLWLTVLFANFAQVLSEGRGRARAVLLRKGREDVVRWRLQPGLGPDRLRLDPERRGQAFAEVASSALRVGAVVF